MASAALDGQLGARLLNSSLAGRDGGMPRYDVTALNQSIANLLERGFAPRFLLDATVSRPQLKKGHLWLSLVDQQSSINAVIWASQIAKLSYLPQDGDGVVVVGKLNFWANRANLSVQILDVRPSLSSVLRQFEQVKERLEPEGLFEPSRKRALPAAARGVALLTSVPSSALADMLRTAAERWPSTRLLVVPSDTLAATLSDHAGKRIAVLSFGTARAPKTLHWLASREARVYAHNLYAHLRAMDVAGCELLIVEAPPEGADWDGINDRLKRAAFDSRAN